MQHAAPRRPAGSRRAIAVLRLDTDWCESTRHEMHHLFPRLSADGVLIVDDFGHWQGARRAIDEYFLEQGGHYLKHRIDYTGRMLIKNWRGSHGSRRRVRWHW
jgi:hypothetical protein